MDRLKFDHKEEKKYNANSRKPQIFHNRIKLRVSTFCFRLFSTINHMKAILNWRYYVCAALFAIGLIATLVSFGDSATPVDESLWTVRTACSAITAAACFFATSRLYVRWEREGKMSEAEALQRDDD